MSKPYGLTNSLIIGFGLLTSMLLQANEAPRVLRFISDSGVTCIGRVVVTFEGAPSEVENLGGSDPSFCGEVTDDEQLAQLLRAFKHVRTTPVLSSAIEKVDSSQLAERILSPVQISEKSLRDQQRFIVAAGLNYADHRSETGFSSSASEDDLLLFAKRTAPTGAYQDVPIGYRLGTTEKVALLDYEVELALVLLQEIDLNNLPDEFVFSHNIAFMVANELSDREPIIIAPDTGYVQGKSHPGYLPLGPWMIHGSDIEPSWRQGGRHSLTLSLLVQDEGGFIIRTQQQGLSSQMLFNGYRILQILADRYQRQSLTCMRDRYGVPAALHLADGKLPAGSLILTGTPGGTAIKAPSLADKLGLFIDAGLSLNGARALFLQRQMEAADHLGYLQVGDLVYTAIGRLGRQRWQVVEGAGQPPIDSWPSSSCD
ncbi:fumarylacetoacetate hydrolase family protein [Corallincola spongiicola]|uniref:Fumarylacetoacetase-like C-terminal domain-containing protein n=1 Tax=Corallincola spongiicola TaxID=2520508 RepID=A0ABY1WVC0_9GAMM|nr:fumarylacetoacetate hydrolase family protein [Corallincola spongiicola]TAA48670.1 hypothetical protein EXY25_05510 [Corallincola spongiicola]